MTKFKIGDRVKFTEYIENQESRAWRTGNVGTVSAEWHDRGVQVVWDGTTEETRFNDSQLALAESTLSFVGNPPEPVKAPQVVLPFKVHENRLQDRNGTYIGCVSGDALSDEQDKQLAELIVRLLNQHFEGQA